MLSAVISSTLYKIFVDDSWTSLITPTIVTYKEKKMHLVLLSTMPLHCSLYFLGMAVASFDPALSGKELCSFFSISVKKCAKCSRQKHKKSQSKTEKRRH